MSAVDFTLEPADNERLANLCGQFDEHLRLLERRTGVDIGNRGNTFQLSGSDDAVVVTEQVIRQLYDLTATKTISAGDVHLELSHGGADDAQALGGDDTIRTWRTVIRARGANQRRYLEAIRNHDINFGIGPAGTGKTYLAVASAVAALESDSVRRVCLVRPAVEAGERLGFLPGDMAQKIDPYLRPLYDALSAHMEPGKLKFFLESDVIEIAPLAYMRGRTLDEAFIILDEAQNTTRAQMKMFLTRMGQHSKVVVTGDETQTDLPDDEPSGLIEAVGLLKNVSGIGVVRLDRKDIVRHPLVQRIVNAYEQRAPRRDDDGRPLR